jgi:hypothetical protein
VNWSVHLEYHRKQAKRAMETAGTHMDSHSSLFVKLAYGNARSMKPLSTHPHPLPNAQAERT